MARHPDVFLPSVKEPHFFSWPEVTDTYYRATIVGDEVDYLALYGGRQAGQLAGDFSTSYLFRTEAAARIHHRRPDAAIVIVLRNPAERALSHYRMDVRDRNTDRPLADLIAEPTEDQRFRREYIDVGRYANQVRRYLDTFPAEQIHIVLFDDLVTAPATSLTELYRFLGLEVRPPLLDLAPRNESGEARFSAAGRLGPSVVAALGPRLGRRARRAGRAILYRPSPGDAEHPLRAELTELFADDVEELERLIERDLSAWKRQPLARRAEPIPWLRWGCTSSACIAAARPPSPR